MIQKLLESGQKVRALDKQHNPTLDTLPVEFVQADMRDPATLDAAFDGAEIVFHGAAYISIQMDEWQTLEAINVNGVRNMLAMCKKHRIKRLVHFSSIEALSVEPRDRPIDETNALVAADFPIPYPRSKAAGQRLVLQAIQDGLDAVILHPTGIIGPNDYGVRATNQLFLPVLNGQVPALPRLGYDFVDVRDVVAGAIAAQQNAPTGRNYVLGNARYLLTDLAARLAALVGHPAPRALPPWMMTLILPLMDFNAKRTGEPSVVTRASFYPLMQSHAISHERATRELGYQPRSIDETLADTVAWFKEIGKVAKAGSNGSAAPPSEI